MKHKVLAYLTRQKNGQTQLIVFDHHDYPDTGRQAPAGTIEEDEAPGLST